MTPPPPGTEPELVTALDQLAVQARVAELDPEAARAEGAAFAAAIAESAPGAAKDWAQQLGRTVADFFDAAVSARRWRGSPTATLSSLVEGGGWGAAGYARALTDVAAAACSLGEPTMRVVANASAAAAAQLAAAGVQPGDIILGVNGKRVKSSAELQEAAKAAGKTVALLIQRDDAQIFVPLRLN